MNKNGYLLAQMIFHASAFLETFIDFPPSQTPDSFTIDGFEEKVNRAIAEKAGKPQ
jgi:arylsulfatase